MKRTKTITSKKYQLLIKWLVTERTRQNVTMQDLSARLGEARTFAHKVETLERRLDLLEYCDYCEALNLDPKIGLEILTSANT